MKEKIKELYYMCSDNDFSIARAEKLINCIDINAPFSKPGVCNSLTTFLSEACLYINVKMVKLLLERGADPNYILYANKPGWRENPFWDLQYNVYH